MLELDPGTGLICVFIAIVISVLIIAIDIIVKSLRK